MRLYLINMPLGGWRDDKALRPLVTLAEGQGSVLGRHSSSQAPET